MRTLFTLITIVLATTSLKAQITYEFSLSFVGINSATGNYQMALLATPSASVTNHSTDDMGAGFYVPTGLTIGNFVTGNSNLPASEWFITPMGSGTGGDAYFLGRDEAGAFSVLLNGSGPFQLVLFDVIANPNPSSGEIKFVENGDPVFDTIFIENYINIAAQNLYAQNNPAASAVQFNTLHSNSAIVFEDLSVFPNPAQQELFLKSSTLSHIRSVIFHSIDGKKVYENSHLSIVNNSSKIDVSSFSNALYFMTVTSKNGGQETYKVLIQR